MSEGTQPQSPRAINPGPTENEGQEGGNIWIKLNESRDEKHSEVLETVKSLKAELQSVKTDNERILKAQEELNQMLLSKLKGPQVEETKGPISSTAGTGKLKRKTSEQTSSSSEADSAENNGVNQDQGDSSSSGTRSSEPRKLRKKHKHYDEISGEFKKIKPPVFNGEVETGEEAEAWLSGMHKYFQIYNYSGELKAKMAIYNLVGKADIWWQDVKRVKRLSERDVSWKTFKKLFKK